ncbi:RRP12-like protein [Schistocerca gregaria]|uniref:RRP12-like protein n=1 Tax=Schistocerca gregaria TaxID=7010 RepID=UPI00211E6FB7|nr:RRP12-like protein [Schistocerca gregaria]
MGSFRHRVKGKGKRWKKGHSSSSNPEIQKHRDIAKSRFFQENLGQSGLTTEALKKHDAFTTKMDTESSVAGDFEEGTIGGTFKTFQTFASDWSSCSNMSFSRLLNGFRSDSALHKEMLAVLAAVTEVIKSYKGRESSVEYFAALMSTLEKSDTEISVAAVLSLIGMCIKGVPESLLKLKFSETSKLLVDLLGKYSETENNVILRTLIGCLSVLLRAQDAAVWTYSSTLQVLDSILTFTTHSKPKVRKAAQHAVCAVLRGSSIMLDGAPTPPPAHHPAAKHVAKFCNTQMETSGSLGGSTTTLHVLNLLKDIIFAFPKAQVKTVCETVLKIMTLGDTRIISCGLQALHGLFISRPSSKTLPGELNAQLVTALFDYQPAASDTSPTLAWLLVMQEAHINLAKVDINLCLVNVPRFFSVAIQMWSSERPEVRAGTTHAMEALAQECFTDHSAASDVRDVALAKAVSCAQAGLSYQYHDSWPHVMHLLGILYEVALEKDYKLFLPSLKILGDLRDSHQFSYSRELEYAVGKAIRSLGPRTVLSAIPLELVGEERTYDFKRSWLLPVLRDNIQNAELRYFVQFFLPLASRCREKSVECEKQSDMVGAHSYDLLQSQIWALLPGFCNRPSDIKENFKSIARILGTAINERKDLRLSVMASLRKLISGSKEMNNEEDLAELSRFAKNFLPILFNLYTIKAKGSDEEGHRLSAYETIKVYLEITDSPLRNDLFDRAVIKLNAEDSDDFVKKSILDLLRLLLPYQDVKRLSKLYEHCKQLVPQIKDRQQQKKSYRLLEELCSSKSESCQKFVKENLSDLKALLITSLSKSAPSSKGPRLRCLIHLMRELGEPDNELVEQVIPEAVLCCKDINERCRTAAYALLVEVGEAMRRWAHKPDVDVLRDYMGLLMVGLAGQPRMASASLLALTKVIHHLKDIIPVDLVEQMLDNVCLLLLSSTREIVVSCLSYIKMFVTSFPPSIVTPAVPTIVKSFVGMTEDCKRHFRLKTRNILSRFVRKYDYDTIANMIPSSDTVMHKRLKNIRKVQSKKKRDKEKSEVGSSDDDEDEQFKIKGQPKSIEEILAESDDSDFEEHSEKSKVVSKRKKQPGTWIKEDEESFIDFTDSSAAKRITATNPRSVVSKEMQRKKASSDFKVASDGRLIITEDSDDENESSNKFKKLHLSDSESGDEDGETKSVAASSVGPIVGRKRRMSVSTDAQSEPAMKYRAGGTGIHRPVKKAVHKGKGKTAPSVTLGSEYRAKKAQGDMKRKGRPDPYAYLPLSRKFLNKRKKAKQSGHFSSVIKGAKKGAMKGSKAKSKGLKRRK